MTCKIEGCDKEVKYAGMCGMHYKRWWRHRDPLKTETPGRGFISIPCKADEGCDRMSAYSDGLCEKHYNMLLYYQRTHTIMNKQGEGGHDSAGYYLITVNGRRVLEHIYLAEKALGKPLPKGAVVHHMNGIRDDNHTPLNLVICPDQSYHMKLHQRMKELGYENN
jgi:hypothetical protein